MHCTVSRARRRGPTGTRPLRRRRGRVCTKTVSSPWFRWIPYPYASGYDSARLGRPSTPTRKRLSPVDARHSFTGTAPRSDRHAAPPSWPRPRVHETVRSAVVSLDTRPGPGAYDSHGWGARPTPTRKRLSPVDARHSFTGTAPRSDRHAAPPSSPRPRVHETVRSAVVSLDTRPGPSGYDSHGWGARPTPTRKRLSPVDARHSFTGTAPRSDRHAAPPSSPRPRVHETVRSAVVSLDTRPGPGAYDSHGWGARPTPTRKRLSPVDARHSFTGTAPRSDRHAAPPSSPRPRVHETVRSAVVSLDTRPGPGAYDSHGWGARPTPTRKRLSPVDARHSFTGTAPRSDRHAAPPSSPRPRVHETVRSAVVSLDTRPGPGAYDSHGWGARPTPTRKRLSPVDARHSFTGTAPRSDRHAAPPSSPRPRVHETVRSAVVSLDTRPGPGAYDSHGWGARPTPTRKRLSPVDARHSFTGTAPRSDRHAAPPSSPRPRVHETDLT
ncbi:unnamed protein product [Macrosiphum euphorbiae]|uniref:Uncharacterized protein n=1 Tax=Macrosiphum euphorbiae TaxID=13131 RepID=A0AAV0Y2E0_9HEMI|nr:unnamed protein product [Macrosiphum euphorbiae]